MADTYRPKFERRCRLCAQEQEVTIMLFSDQAADMLLLEKLHNYLLIEIDYTDTLPKNICLKCCFKLQDVCEFIEKVRESQDNLRGLCLPVIANEKDTNEPDQKLTRICEENFKTELKEQYIYPFANEVVTLKLIEKDQNDIDFNNFTVEPPWIQEEVIRECPPSYHKCDVCPRGFKTEEKYKKHMKLHNPAGRIKSYTCEICTKTYQNLTEIQDHNITHCSERPFQCSHCLKSFKRSQQLKIHLLTHAEILPTADCIACSMSKVKACHKHRSSLTEDQHWSLDNSSLARQKKETQILKLTVSNARKYKCHFCDKEFGRHENYSYHVYKHNGKKPYVCSENQCTSTFFTYKNLFVHYEKMHPNISKPPMTKPIFF